VLRETEQACEVQVEALGILDVVESKLRVGYKAGVSAGYRDVALNMRVRSASAPLPSVLHSAVRTALRGAAARRSQVQLLLAQFAELKHE